MAQAAHLSQLEIKQGDRTPVCCTDVGGLYDPTNFERWWSAFRKAHGFPTLKFHELRHTQATQLLANGVDVKTVQARLGHSDPGLTLRQYTRALSKNDEAASALFDELLEASAAPGRDVSR